MIKDKFILRPQPKTEGYRPVMVRIEAYEMLKQMSEESGVSMSFILSEAIRFAMERMEVGDATDE